MLLRKVSPLLGRAGFGVWWGTSRVGLLQGFSAAWRGSAVRRSAQHSGYLPCVSESEA